MVHLAVSTETDRKSKIESDQVMLDVSECESIESRTEWSLDADPGAEYARTYMYDRFLLGRCSLATHDISLCRQMHSVG